MSQGVSSGGPKDSVRLDSWKEIANHLGREIRTVQRWEKFEGLPVHRLQHQKRGSVYAFTEELDAWWRERRSRLDAAVPETEPTQKIPKIWNRKTWVVTGVAACALGLIIAAVALRPSSPEQPDEVPVPPFGRLFGHAGADERSMLEIAVGANPERLLLSRDGRRLFVADHEGDSVSIIDTGSNRVIATVAVGHQPRPMVLSPNGAQLYVGQEGGDITVIDTATWRTRTIGLQGDVSDLAITPDGSSLYAAVGRAGLVRIDLSTMAVQTHAGAQCPEYLAISSDGTLLFVSYQCGGPGGSSGHDSIDALRLPSEELAGTIRGLPLVGGNLVFSPDGAVVWVNGLDACSNPVYKNEHCPVKPGGIVHVIRSADRMVLTSVSLPQSATLISMSPDGSHVFAGADAGIASIDTRTFTVDELYPLQGTGSIVFSRDGRHAYVPLPRRNAVAVLDVLPGPCTMPGNLQHWWSADGTPNDVINRLHGTLHGDVRFVPGRVGESFAFTGPDSYVEIPTSDDVPQNEFTVSAWLKFSAGNPRTMPVLDEFRTWRDGSDGFRILKKSDNRVEFCMGAAHGDGCAEGSPTAVTSAAPLQPDEWYHVAVAVSHGTATLFVNGEKEGSTEQPGIWRRQNQLRLGGGTAGQFFQGQIDEVQLYARALPAREILSVYRAGSKGQCGITTHN